MIKATQFIFTGLGKTLKQKQSTCSWSPAGSRPPSAKRIRTSRDLRLETLKANNNIPKLKYEVIGESVIPSKVRKQPDRSKVLMKNMIMLLSLTFVSSTWALDTARCPSRIPFRAQVTKVHKSSIYSPTPGWKEAQRTLSSIESFETEFKLVSKTTEICKYQDNDLGQATLSTAQFQDPEEPNPTKVQQLIVNFKDGNSTFVSFIPVSNVSQNGIILYSSPFAVKIKAKLYFSEAKRSANIDMGMVAVSLK